jgi:hypothetical protein
MSRSLKRSVCALCAPVLFLACSSEGSPRGGLVVTIANDGSLVLDHLKLQVSANDSVLLQNEFAVPETALPNTLSVVSNGSATATATIVVSAWRNGVPVDRRDAIVTQIPSDRVAGFTILLSARCTPLVKPGVDPTTAESLCSARQTCDPSLGRCTSAEVSARDLPDYDPNALGGAADGGPRQDGDAAAPGATGCSNDEECTTKLLATTPAGCAVATCNLTTKKCVFRAKDTDGDGVLPKECSAPGLAIETGNECDDDD